MKKEIADLLLYLDSKDIEERRWIPTEIAMLLEMNTYILNGGQSVSRLEEYENYLTEDLISIRLSIEEHAELIDELIKRISAKDELSSSMFWAIGKAYPTVGLPKLIEIIKCSWGTFDESMSSQSIIALDNYIIFYMDKGLKAKLLPMEKEVINFLQNKSEVADKGLADYAKRTLCKLEIK